MMLRIVFIFAFIFSIFLEILLIYNIYKSKVFNVLIWCMYILWTDYHKMITHEFSNIRYASSGMRDGCCNALSMSPIRTERLFPQLPRVLVPCSYLKAESFPRSYPRPRGEVLHQVMAHSEAVHIQFLVHVWIMAFWPQFGTPQPPTRCCGCIAIDFLLINPASFTLPQPWFLRAITKQPPTHESLSQLPFPRKPDLNQRGGPSTTCCWMKKENYKQYE